MSRSRLVAAAKRAGAITIQYFNADAPLYPETVDSKGSIVWTVPEEPEVPEEIQKPEQSTPNDSDADTELKGMMILMSRRRSLILLNLIFHQILHRF